jgi:hypothetical protein
MLNTGLYRLRSGLAILALACLAASLCAEPIRLHPDNPHYFLFDSRPTILITSAEHYGAVVNRDFDYIAYLETLKAYGLNYTRIYPGALFEPEDKFVKGNTLGVQPQSLILPWARSGQPGYAQGGNLFDLDKWDEAYFERLRDFVDQAARRGVVVEICFFNAQYEDTWPISPLFQANNVQHEGDRDFNDAQTLKHPDLVRREEDYVAEIVRRVNEFDNVILEICDEPILNGTPPELAGPWLRHFADLIQRTESTLPKKHLVAQQMQGALGGPCDLTGYPAVPLIVSQYVWDTGVEQMGGMKALDLEYGHRKPIELNETDYYPIWYKGDKIADSRVEAWEFIVGGGAGFNHLNGLYTVADPAGKTPDNDKICHALKNLKEFMYGFDFVRMSQDKETVAGGWPDSTYGRGISEPGRQYAFYHHHSEYKKGAGAYTVIPGNYTDKLRLSLPAGSYTADWIDPASGAVVRTDRLRHPGGEWAVTTPAHAIDLALRVKRDSKQ